VADCFSLANIKLVFLTCLEVSIDDTSISTLHDDHNVSVRNNGSIYEAITIRCFTFKIKASNIHGTFRACSCGFFQSVKLNVIPSKAALHLVSKAESHFLTVGVVARILVDRQIQVCGSIDFRFFLAST
jgi:hypothetical protein